MSAVPADPPGRTASASWRVAAALLAIEALGAVSIVFLLATADLTATATSARDAVGVTSFAAVMAAVFVGCAVAALRRRAWVRGPAVVLQLLLIPLAWTMVSDDMAWLGIPILVLAAVATVSWLAPSTRETLGVVSGGGGTSPAR